MRFIMDRFKVMRVDAWGNEVDGYEKNNWFTVGHVELPEDVDDDRIVDIMIEAGFLVENCHDKVFVENDIGDYICITDRKGYPLFDLMIDC